MSNPQLPVGPNDSASLIYSDSIFETGQISLNGSINGNAINILSTSDNALTIDVSISVSSNIFLGMTKRWKMETDILDNFKMYQLNNLGTSYILMSKLSFHS